jgi:glycosyltransferase involved in cell wall biosynthesis
MQSTPFVSIVTPFFNTQEFLPECIESVLRQTYENWEYILVDNCSTDGSSEIAKRYASRFPGKVRLLHTSSFLSQVQNYNFALSCISPDSKYCKMVQADDWLFPDCVRALVEMAEDYPSVGIVSAYELAGETVDLDGLPYPSPEVSGRDACRLYFLKGKYVFGSPTSSLIRSEVIRSQQPFYQERHAPLEDAHACFQLLRTWNFGFVHQVLTYSRRDNESIISRICPFGFLPLSRFSILLEHGKYYLSEAEYRSCLKHGEREYFLHLTKSACALRPESQEFWAFHRNWLASVNYPFDWKRLTRWLPRAIAEKAWGAFWRRWDKDSYPDLDSVLTFQHHQTAGAKADRQHM